MPSQLLGTGLATAKYQGRKHRRTIKEIIAELQAEDIEQQGAGMFRVAASDALSRETLDPLIDMAYSEHSEVQRDAASVIATLSFTSSNHLILVNSGCLKPLLMLACSVDLGVRRHAMSALANLSTSEDLRERLVAADAVPALIKASDTKDPAMQALVAECLANIAQSRGLRGKLITGGGMPVLGRLIASHNTSAKRWGMVALQRLAMSNASGGAGGAYRSKEHPDGDGFANEIIAQGGLRPLIKQLGLKDEEARLQGLRCIYLIADSSDSSRWMPRNVAWFPTVPVPSNRHRHPHPHPHPTRTRNPTPTLIPTPHSPLPPTPLSTPLRPAPSKGEARDGVHAAAAHLPSRD